MQYTIHMTYRDEELRYFDNYLFMLHCALRKEDSDKIDERIEKARKKGLLGGIKK